MTMILDGSNGVTFNDSSLQGAAASPYVLKNRIINGAMVIDQRNAGASTTPTTNATFNLDRWRNSLTQASKFSVQQNAASVTPPTGFTNYLGVTSTSAYSVTSGDIFGQIQVIEGFNIADLGWGTANAKTITISFWVRSSLTGTFGGSLSNGGASRSYPFTYTISSANTWEQKSITIAGDTSGTWNTTNGVGIALNFSLGTGSTYSGTAGAWAGAEYYSATGATSVVGTNGATFYITGVQLEQNTSATPFERRLYGTELNLCYRYCWNLSAVGGNDNYTRFGVGGAEGTGSAEITILPPQTFRGSPSLTTTGTASQYAGYSGGSIIAASTITMVGAFNPQSLLINIGASGAFTAGREVTLMANNNKTAYLLFTAEL
jgi:hypothetical protein